MCKNFFIQKAKQYKKKTETDISFDKNIINFLENNEKTVERSCDVIAEKKEFILLLREEIKSWKKKFIKEQERVVLDGIILLFFNPDLAEILNKKGIFLYLREITGLNTKQIVNSLGKFRKKYNLFKSKYLRGDI